MNEINESLGRVNDKLVILMISFISLRFRVTQVNAGP